MGDSLDAKTGMTREELTAHFERLKLEIKKDVMTEVKNEWSADVKNLLNGAQASLMLSWQMNGDPKFGVEGFMPSVNRRLEEQEVTLKKKIDDDCDRRKVDDERFDAITRRQNLIHRCVAPIRGAVAPLIKFVDLKVVALGALLLILQHVPLWLPLQRAVSWTVKLLSQHVK